MDIKFVKTYHNHWLLEHESYISANIHTSLNYPKRSDFYTPKGRKAYFACSLMHIQVFHDQWKKQRKLTRAAHTEATNNDTLDSAPSPPVHVKTWSPRTTSCSESHCKVHCPPTATLRGHVVVFRTAFSDWSKSELESHSARTHNTETRVRFRDVCF